MISTTIFPGRYIQGYNAIKRLGTEIVRFGKKAFIICDKFIYDNFLPDFRQEIEYKVDSTFEIFDEDECSDEEIERLAFAARKIGADIIVGIGGGKTIDTAKVVANDIKISMISVPTCIE
jgi:glycerol dehydrogenase